MTENNSNTIECPHCNKQTVSGFHSCKHCSKPLRPKTFYDPNNQSAFKEETQNRVTVIGFDMPFPSMVKFMIKWAIAIIPAMIILIIVGMIFTGIFGAFFAKLFPWGQVYSVPRRIKENLD